MVTTRPTTAWAPSATTMQSVVVRRLADPDRQRAGDGQDVAGAIGTGPGDRAHGGKSEPLNDILRQLQHDATGIRCRLDRLTPHGVLVDPTEARLISVSRVLQFNVDDDLTHDILQAPLSQRGHAPPETRG